MDDGNKSGLFYPNRFINQTLRAYASILGENGLSSVLNMAGLSSLIENPLPDNLDKQFDFTDFASIQVSLDDVFGVRGAKGISQRAGETTLNLGLDQTGSLVGVKHAEFQRLPWETRLLVGLSSMASMLTHLTDQVITVSQSPDSILLSIKQCPVCWDRRNLEKPACSFFNGQLQALSTWFSGGQEFHITESKCIGMGDEACEFIIPKTPIR